MLMDTRLEFREQLSEYSEERHKEQSECERCYCLAQSFSRKHSFRGWDAVIDVEYLNMML
jgi:hypothetical protein